MSYEIYSKKVNTKDIWERYGYVPPKIPAQMGRAVFEPSDNCFGYKKGRGCVILSKTWCKYEECRFFKPRG